MTFFVKKLDEPWSDVEATLCYVVQRIPIFKEKRMMVKLKNIHDDRETGEFEFKAFLTKWFTPAGMKVMKRRCHQMCFSA